LFVFCAATLSFLPTDAAFRYHVNGALKALRWISRQSFPAS
jgi:hypothetical protein